MLREIDRTLSTVGDRIAMLTTLEEGGRRRRTIDVGSELQDALGLLRPLLDASGIEIEIRAPDRGLLRVDMRPETFRRILHILVQNAVDWLHLTAQPLVRVRARETDGRCEIVFSDSGPGIPAADAERVFEPGFTTREVARGMGLTLARDIIGRHGGTIEVLVDGRRSGANLRILLPRKRPRATVHHD
jgi:signal transduction histidine kinase